jgi:hypothetical protein
MTNAAEYRIGSTVECEDRVCGELRRVIVDPVSRTLTHLVVKPRHEEGLTRLVPVALVDQDADGIRLRCTGAEYDAFEDGDDRHFVPGPVGEWDYRRDQLLAWPYYLLRRDVSTAPPTPYDGVPLGTVEIRRGESVHAVDGDLGRVQGLIVDGADHDVTHVLLHVGRLWAKRRTAIPIGAVERVDEHGIRLRLSVAEVRALPPVDIEGGSD